MIHFTSDTHFFHRKMAEHRGFDGDLNAMNAAMVAAWNKVVRCTDTVYHLGDVSFSGHTKAQEVFEQLNGYVHIVPGNHDEPKALARLSTRNGEVNVLPMLSRIKVPVHSTDGSGDTSVQRIILCHFPLQVWDQAHHGAWHLHGHSHGFLAPVGRRLDVGVDGYLTENFGPVSFERVRQFMSLRSYVQQDQHNEKAAA